MEHDNTFWNDIKKLEDILTENPASYCFAKLSELYRKTGLLEDAINTAEKGCQMLPEYVGGWLALAYAALEKGDTERGSSLLARVVRATPENVDARTSLLELYLNSGELRSAQDLLKVIVSLDSNDEPARELLDSLSVKISSVENAPEASINQQSVDTPVAQGTVELETISSDSFDEELVEELFLLEDEDLVEEVVEQETELQPGLSESKVEVTEASAVDHPEPKDPLTTGTLAELYVAQGFTDKALAIYRELILLNPDNPALLARIRELEGSLSPEIPIGGQSSEPGEEVEPEVTVALVGNQESSAGESTVQTLERWLGNIARRR